MGQGSSDEGRVIPWEPVTFLSVDKVGKGVGGSTFYGAMIERA